MLTVEEIDEAIVEIENAKHHTVESCMKLAGLMIVRENLCERECEEENSTESEFMKAAIEHHDPWDVLKIIDKFMEEIKPVNPRLYNSVITKIKKGR